MIMIAHPPIVKIVVPIPPVDGREESLVSVMLVFASSISVAIHSPSSPVFPFSSVITNVADDGFVLTEYPSGAVFSVNL